MFIGSAVACFLRGGPSLLSQSFPKDFHSGIHAHLLKYPRRMQKSFYKHNDMKCICQWVTKTRSIKYSLNTYKEYFFTLILSLFHTILITYAYLMKSFSTPTFSYLLSITVLLFLD